MLIHFQKIKRKRHHSPAESRYIFPIEKIMIVGPERWKYLNSKNENKSAVGAPNSKLWEFSAFLWKSGNLWSITYTENGSKIHWHTECQQPVYTSLLSFPFGVQRKPSTNERAKRASSKIFFFFEINANLRARSINFYFDNFC